MTHARSASIHDLCDKAWQARQPLIRRKDLDACRLLHDQADGTPGLVIERFGPVLIVQMHEERLRLNEPAVREAAMFFHERLGTQAVYRKFFVKDRSRPSKAAEQEHHRAEPWIGQPCQPEVSIVENGLRFLIHPYDGFSTGLFLEHRDNRKRIRDIAGGKRVLNTFSYTCAFSVAAAAGGAAIVDSVDLSRRYLEWGKRNVAANGLPLENHRFFCSDILEFYRRAERQGRRYDLIILDPPTFSRLGQGGKTFVLKEQLDVLCEGAGLLLEPRGRILLAANDRQLNLKRFTAALKTIPRRQADIEVLPLPIDFAGDPDYARAVFATFS